MGRVPHPEPHLQGGSVDELHLLHDATPWEGLQWELLTMGTFFSLQGSQPSLLHAGGKMVFVMFCMSRCTALHEEAENVP